MRWRNIFYFLSYCNNFIDKLYLSEISFEHVKGFYDLLGTLLNLYFSKVCKFGYIKQYENTIKIADKPVGNIDFISSYNQGLVAQGKLICNTSELSIDTTVNQIIKLAYSLLLSKRSKLTDITIEKALYNYVKLSGVSNIGIQDYIKRSMNMQIPKYYIQTIKISELIIKDWMLTDKSGNNKLHSLTDDERLEYIWEEFLRNYIKRSLGAGYRVEKKNYISARCNAKVIRREPDIVIYSDNKDKPILILDAKWYENSKLDSHIYNQLYVYANDIKKIYSNRKIKAFAIFGYGEDKSDIGLELEQCEDIEIGAYTINVNQDFELIKLSIDNMINKQLDV